MSAPLPVTVIGGFLGAGKTTLINRLLAAADAAGSAVLVNDFGAVNVDERLIVARGAQVLSLANGCLCCTVQDDLVAQLAALVGEHGGSLERIVIETSGVADPARVLLTLGYPQLRPLVYASSIVTLLDATRFAALTGPARELAEAQRLAADLAVLTKTDLAPPEAVAALRESCRELDIRCLDGADLAAITAALFAGDLVQAERLAAAALAAPTVAAFESRVFRVPGPLRLAPLRSVLGRLPGEVYRVKGFVSIADVPGECSVQVVGPRVDIRKATGEARGEAHDALVFIGLAGRVDWSAIGERLGGCAAGSAAPVSDRPP